MIKDMLKNHIDLQENLFIRGFLATTRKDINLADFPFYGNWNCVEIQNVKFLTHKLTGFAWCLGMHIIHSQWKLMKKRF